ncbi:MAG: hypothetical protein AAGF46_00105 [Pseudomonadota bacterium]
MATDDENRLDAQRRIARRNVWLLVLLAFSVYGGFILSGVLRSQGGG